MRFRFAWGVLALLAVGCGSRSETPATKTPPKVAPADPWVLTCLDPNAGEPALLWNGLIGIRIGRDGTGNGKTAGFFAIDDYETSGEEKIRTLENPLAIYMMASDGEARDTLSPQSGIDYSQRLDMRTGELETTWRQKVGEATITIHGSALVHPTERIILARWSFESDRPVGIEQVNRTFHNAPGEDDGLLTRTSNFFVPSVKGVGGVPVPPLDPRYAMDKVGPPLIRPDHASFGIDASHPGGSEWVYQYRPGPNARLTSKWHARPGVSFSSLEKESSRIWAERWKTDVEIDGPVEDQQAVRSFLFYLRSAIHPDGGMSISPFGLSNEQYNGHVFWDADIWVFPALAFVDPRSAASIVEYRGRRYKAAQENYKAWIAAGRPTGMKPMGPYRGDANEWPGAMFPWESSVSGRETVPGPSRFEHHITGSVYHTMSLARWLGLEIPSVDYMGTTRGAATFYMARSEKGADGLRDIKGTMSPDENHIGDNDLYTNLLAQEVTDDGLWKLPAAERPKFRLPKDDETFLTYDNDPIRGYKQAAAVLSIYPLQYPPAEKQARAMMDRFGDKVIKNGPAMTDSIHALIWARLGEKDRAYETWQKSWKPFTTSPLLLFSEKRLRPTTYFTTGAAGSLQTVLFGFLGFRIDYEKEPGAAWATQLKGDSWLSIKPNLPSNWKSVKFKNFNVLGRRYTLTATPSAAQVTPGE